MRPQKYHWWWIETMIILWMDRIVLAIPMKLASISIAFKIVKWYEEQLSSTLIGNLEMSWQRESTVNRKQSKESNLNKGLLIMD